MSIAVKATLEQALREADESFRASGDVMEALAWVASAAQMGAPLPPAIAKWMHDAIVQYSTGKAASLDKALGLADRGRPPRRRRDERNELQGALARMCVLQMVGATVLQAAAMVARLSPTHTAQTLQDRYKRSGLGARVRADRGSAQPRWHWSEVEKLLSEYPDTPLEVAQAKAAIRKVYARQRI